MGSGAAGGGAGSGGAVSTAKVKKASLLQPTQPGQNKQIGLGVEGALVKAPQGESGSLLCLTFQNASQQALEGSKFAIQLNQNPFGLSAGKPLAGVMPASISPNNGRCE